MPKNLGMVAMATAKNGRYYQKLNICAAQNFEITTWPNNLIFGDIIVIRPAHKMNYNHGKILKTFKMAAICIYVRKN